LQTGVFTNNRADSYGDALHRLAIAVHDNFPEKSTSVGENRTYKALKIHGLSSESFPKKLFLGRVYPSRTPAGEKGQMDSGSKWTILSGKAGMIWPINSSNQYNTNIYMDKSA
jgi:hypothetical protein